MLFDAHVHVFDSPEAGLVAQGGEQRCGFDGSLPELRGLFDAGVLGGACAVSALPIALWRDLYAESWPSEEVGERLTGLAAAQNAWLVKAAAAEPRLLVAVGAEALLPAREQLDRLGEVVGSPQVRAVKVHPALNFVDPGHPGYHPVYRLAQDAGLPVISHGGTSAGTFYAAAVEHCAPERFAPVLAAFPDLRVVVAHCAVPFLDGLLALGADFPNLCTDLSYVLGSGIVPPAELGAFVRAFGVDRVMFGSDFPYFDPGSGHELLTGCGLSAGEIAQVTVGTAARLLGA